MHRYDYIIINYIYGFYLIENYLLFNAEQLNFDLYLTKPQLNHLKNISNAMISKGFEGKVSDIAELAPVRHRTNITRFFSSSSWDETLLFKNLYTKTHLD